MKYRFHPDAIAEYEGAARYYADRKAALELRSIECVESAVRSVADAPTRWALFEDDVRRCLVHVFPYAVLYTIEADYILILAIMHCSREPGYWRGRIESAR